jgi:hypothetical protein
MGGRCFEGGPRAHARAIPDSLKKASSEESVGDSRGIMAEIADHLREFAPPFPALQAGAHCVE